MLTELIPFIVAGFAAQLIDGALGMAYGVTASSLLLGLGVPPVTASATVHAAECFTTGVSALSHRAFGNVDPALFRRLVVPGVIGAGSGAFLLTRVPGEALRPIVAAYLGVMGAVILVKAYREFPPRIVGSHLGSLGFLGAFADAVGGGGWGPIVATTLIARGSDPRRTVGSVIAVEFFVTIAASTTFLLTVGLDFWRIILGLALGGLLAAPVGAWLCRRLPMRPLMVAVGLLVMGLAGHTLGRALGAW